MYAAIADKMGKKPTFVSLPYSLVSAGLNTIELLRIPLNVSNENLLGLKQLKAFDTKADLEKLGVTIADMDTALNQLLKP
jgi:hypothetical protein